MKEVLQILAAFAIAIVVVLGLLWIIWHLWCFVVPSIWAAAPESVSRPSYWLFVAAWTLLGLVGRAFFGRRTA